MNKIVIVPTHVFELLYGHMKFSLWMWSDGDVLHLFVCYALH